MRSRLLTRTYRHVQLIRRVLIFHPAKINELNRALERFWQPRHGGPYPLRHLLPFEFVVRLLAARGQQFGESAKFLAVRTGSLV